MGTTIVEAFRRAEREQSLRNAARGDVAQRGTLAAVLPGFGTEDASSEDVAIASRIIGRDVRMIPDRWGRTGEDRRVNVALLRSQLRRWAVRESIGLRRTDGAA